jgi:hypothetical protein
VFWHRFPLTVSDPRAGVLGPPPVLLVNIRCAVELCSLILLFQQHGLFLGLRVCEVCSSKN